MYHADKHLAKFETDIQLNNIYIKSHGPGTDLPLIYSNFSF